MNPISGSDDAEVNAKCGPSTGNTFAGHGTVEVCDSISRHSVSKEALRDVGMKSNSESMYEDRRRNLGVNSKGQTLEHNFLVRLHIPSTLVRPGNDLKGVVFLRQYTRDRDQNRFELVTGQDSTVLPPDSEGAESDR